MGEIMAHVPVDEDVSHMKKVRNFSTCYLYSLLSSIFPPRNFSTCYLYSLLSSIFPPRNFSTCYLYSLLSLSHVSVGLIATHRNTSLRQHTTLHRSHMSHVPLRHVTHIAESCHTYRWVMSHVPLSHVTRTAESCHTYCRFSPFTCTNISRNHSLPILQKFSKISSILTVHSKSRSDLTFVNFRIFAQQYVSHLSLSHLQVQGGEDP